MYRITTLLLLFLCTACADIIGPAPEQYAAASGEMGDMIRTDDNEELRTTLIALRQQDKLEQMQRLDEAPASKLIDQKPGDQKSVNQKVDQKAVATATPKQIEPMAQDAKPAQDSKPIREQLWVRISFKSGDTKVSTKMSKDLVDIAGKFLAEPRNQTLVVRGFCDGEPIGGYGGKRQSRHAFKSQVALSQARAQAVADILTSAGIQAGVIQVEGYGADYFIADNETAAGRDRNRRVDVFLVGS